MSENKPDGVILVELGLPPKQKLTHKEMEAIITRVLEEKGWQRITDKRLSMLRNPVDRIFQKGEVIAAIEVKPTEAGRKELLSGIGQCATMLVYKNVKPYLFVDSVHAEYLLKIIAPLPWLGLVAVDPIRQHVMLYQKPEFNKANGTRDLLVGDGSVEQQRLTQLKGEINTRKRVRKGEFWGEEIMDV